MCTLHRQRWNAGDRGKRLTRPSRHTPKPPCKIVGCRRPFYAIGFCRLHWWRWRIGKRGAALAASLAHRQIAKALTGPRSLLGDEASA